MNHSTAELRQAFLDFFKSQNHEIVPSSPLIPANDPTLLFTNAGMVQFKDVFTGLDTRTYVRAASSQRCVRAGGKHNDLENVGYTARHHTFFEMLGNFSFGDYFKREAIEYAWEFITGVLRIPPQRLWTTVYHDDDEAYRIWTEVIGIAADRCIRIGDKGAKYQSDNFWAMGDTGPCGPCSEIFYDHGPEVAGGLPGSPEEEGDRYIEIWNLVFMQFNRDDKGVLHPLPQPSVDTGMGLERLAAVMQGVHSNYEIDLFQNLLAAVRDLAPPVTTATHASLRVIADHIRSCAFLIADGVIPSNEGRGYVLRRIIRRALRHGHKLGIKDAFFYQLVAPLEREMGAAHPELRAQKDLIIRVLHQEEERFAETLEHGIKILDDSISQLNSTTIPGDIAFKLYDTYGFPVDLTADVAREHGLSVDMAGFDAEMQAQKARARAAGHFKLEWSDSTAYDTCFIGYDHLHGSSTVVALYRDGVAVDTLHSGEYGHILLKETPFYAESGGQVGDQGHLYTASGVRFEVSECKKMGHAHAHIGILQSGMVRIGDTLEAQVNQKTRQATARNHSATHLLHAALRQVIGTHVQQKGSLVAPERLRFDFSHFEAVTSAQLHTLERLVNAHIMHNHAVQTRIMSLEAAKNSGAMALFGEKYGEQVRVLSMGDFSTELCGGTHVTHAGDIGFFKLINESGVAAGVRRLEAITGEAALEYILERDSLHNRLTALLKTAPDKLEEKITQVLEQARKHEKDLERIHAKLASAQGSDLAAQAVNINGLHVLAAELKDADVKRLRDTLDQLKNKLSHAAIVLASVHEGKISLVAGVTASANTQVKAGELVNFVAAQVGGKGGGRADMAQAGGTQPADLPAALASVPHWVAERYAP
jgi:alanyl-tRNA synthetase